MLLVHRNPQTCSTKDEILLQLLWLLNRLDAVHMCPIHGTSVVLKVQQHILTLTSPTEKDDTEAFVLHKLTTEGMY